jgi:hypothetical protein
MAIAPSAAAAAVVMGLSVVLFPMSGPTGVYLVSSGSCSPTFVPVSSLV